MSIISTVPKGAAVEGINPNLLRNWYFVGGGTGRGVFPVNSRGQTSYDTSGFSVDGWKTDGQATAAWTSSYLYLSLKSGQSNYAIIQKISDFNKLDGKNVTVSVLYGSGLVSGTATINMSNQYTYIYSNSSTNFEFISDNRNYALYIRRTNSTPVTIIYAVKLELGDQQTLAHQENGVWVLNEIPDYEEEYYRCITSDADSTDTYANQKVSNITVQCNSVGSSSLRYYNKLIQSTHKVLDSTFSNPAAQTSDITVTTYDGYLDFSNGFASGATTNITLVLGTSGPVLSTSTTAPS